ncbi:MAG: hypothetical protein RL414_234 [Actinomycetota bacterium]
MSNSSAHQMWRGAVVPSSAIALLFIVGSVMIRDTAGLWGALLASATVLIFLSIHLIINALSKNLDPIATMALAMFSYFAKVMLMGAFLAIVAKLTAPHTIDRPAFAATALAITAAWLGGEIRAFLKLRLGLPLPSTGSSDSNSDGNGGSDGSQ